MLRQENFTDLTIVGRKIERSIKRNETARKQAIDVKTNTKTIEAYKKITDRYVYLQQI